MTFRILLSILLITFVAGAHAARVELKDGTIVYGEILNLAEGEDLKVDTQYMDDVTIEWDSIASIQDTRLVTVQLFNGVRLSGPISLDEQGLRIGGPNAEPIDVTRVFQIEEYNQSIWEGFEVYTDLGMNIVRGNNTVTQISTGAGARYDGVRFETSIEATAIVNEQTETTDTRRTTLGFNHTFKFQNNWTATGLYQFETDEQQGLDGRSLAGAAIGKRIINNRRFRLSLDAGAVLNVEDFAEQPATETVEGLLGATIRWRSRNDIDLDATLFAFPNVEQSGRWRAQFDTSLSIDLWGDLDFKVTGYSRYDSDPPEGNANNDWGTTVGLSWKYD